MTGAPPHGGSRGSGVGATATAGRRWVLEDEAEFLRRSIDDADREHEAGDLSDGDYQVLRRRDVAQLTEVERELALLGAAPTVGSGPTAGGSGEPPAVAGTDRGSRGAPHDEVAGGRTAGDPAGPSPGARRRPGRSSRRRRPWLAVLGTVVLAAGVILGVVRATSPRLLGQSATGSVQVNGKQLIDRQLSQAAQQVDLGTTSSIEVALGLYRQVLREDPRQPQALAETGYLEWEAGFEGGQTALADRGRALVFQSIAVQPDDYAAHLFAGTIDLRQGRDATAAVAEFRSFLAEHPPADVVSAAVPIVRAAFTSAGQAPPAGLPSG